MAVIGCEMTVRLTIVSAEVVFHAFGSLFLLELSAAQIEEVILNLFNEYDRATVEYHGGRINQVQLRFIELRVFDSTS